MSRLSNEDIRGGFRSWSLCKTDVMKTTRTDVEVRARGTNTEQIYYVSNIYAIRHINFNVVKFLLNASICVK